LTDKSHTQFPIDRIVLRKVKADQVKTKPNIQFKLNNSSPIHSLYKFIEENEEKKNKKFQNINCEEHSRPAELICTLDRALVCTHCVLFGKYKGHKYRNIQDALHDEKTILQRLVSAGAKLEGAISNNKNKDYLPSIFHIRLIETCSKKLDTLTNDIQQTIKVSFVYFTKIYHDTLNTLEKDLISCARMMIKNIQSDTAHLIEDQSNKIASAGLCVNEIREFLSKQMTNKGLNINLLTDNKRFNSGTLLGNKAEKLSEELIKGEAQIVKQLNERLKRIHLSKREPLPCSLKHSLKLDLSKIQEVLTYRKEVPDEEASRKSSSSTAQKIKSISRVISCNRISFSKCRTRSEITMPILKGLKKKMSMLETARQSESNLDTFVKIDSPQKPEKLSLVPRNLLSKSVSFFNRGCDKENGSDHFNRRCPGMSKLA